MLPQVSRNEIFSVCDFSVSGCGSIEEETSLMSSPPCHIYQTRFRDMVLREFGVLIYKSEFCMETALLFYSFIRDP